MWRTLIRLSLFVFMSMVNVTVKAEVLQEPEGCHNKDVTPCSYFVRTHHERIQWNDNVVRLSKGTSFIRSKEGEYRLVEGEALFESANRVKIQTLFGALYIEKGRVLVKSGRDQTDFYSLDGIVKYQPRGYEKSTFIPVGFSNYMSRVQGNGLAGSGYPKPAELDELLPVWAGLFNKAEVEELENQMALYRGPWRAAVEQSGPLYVETVKRQIAALEAERERLRQLRAARLKEQNYFKDMFRRRNFIE